MPRFDGTGPNGAGSMTGRGQGRCQNDGLGCRFGRGRGLGCRFGRGRNFTDQEQLEALKKERELLDQEIQSLEEK